MNKSISNQSTFFYIVALIIVLIPQYFINLNGHNYWGGDFSEYIQQALNFLKTGIQVNQYYIFNPNYSELAPPNYYPGFPILISPIIDSFGVNYLKLAVFLNTLSILMFVLWFLFLKEYFNKLLVFIVIVLLAYSTFFLSFKNLILSDIPFSIFIAIAFICIQRIEKKQKFNLGLFLCLFISVSLALLTKPLGLSLLVSLVFYSFYTFLLKEDNYKIKIIHYIPIAILSFFVYKLGIPYLLGVVKSQDSHFFTLFAWNKLITTVLYNINYYYLSFVTIIGYNAESYRIFNNILIQVLGLTTLYGLYKFLFKKINFFTVFFIVFFGILLIFPFTQGARYFLPVIPLLLFYFTKGAKRLPFSTQSKLRIFGILIVFGLILPLRIAIVQYAKYNDTLILNSGPMTNEAQELFEFIRKNTDKEAVFVFIKPRVLALHTQRKSFSNQIGFQELEDIEKDINQFKPSYLLSCKEMYNESLENYLEHQTYLDTAFSNSIFTLYVHKKSPNKLLEL